MDINEWSRLLVVCNRYEDIDCRSQSTNLFPAILVKCNRSDTRDFISFMLSELVATQRLHSANRNYYARSVSSDCICLVSWLDSWPINISQVNNIGASGCSWICLSPTHQKDHQSIWNHLPIDRKCFDWAFFLRLLQWMGSFPFYRRQLQLKILELAASRPLLCLENFELTVFFELLLRYITKI